MTGAVPAASTRPAGRLRAALVDEALVALAAALVYAMSLQTGVAALLALPVSRLVGPLAGAAGAGVVPVTLWAVPLVVWFVVRLVYRVVGTGSPSGQTPGKRLAGVRVEGTGTGTPPGYGPALLREAVLAVEVLTVVGLVGALANPPWHDAAARTRIGRATDASA